MMIPSSAARVPEHTDDEVNARIWRRTERNIVYFSTHPEEIDQRLAELDAEWDVERLLEVNAATLALTGTVLGVLVDRRWLLLPAAVCGFLIQHGVQGWCPPLPVLRRMGFRTPQEIEAERYAFKALRGDFRQILGGPGDAEQAARATGRLSNMSESSRVREFDGRTHS